MENILLSEVEYWLNSMEMNDRVNLVLKRNGITRQLANVLPDRDLLDMPNMGRRGIEHLRTF